MAKKYYAVKKGRKTGIFDSWDECKAAVTGFSGAVYKGFPTVSEAENYIDGGRRDTAAYETAEAKAYVDGSYDDVSKSYSYGMVIFHGGIERHFSKRFENDQNADMRNVAGEIQGAMAAMQYCIDNDIKSISIYYDYEGIEKWCSGDWKANKDGTVAYARFYKKVIKDVDVHFVKVKGHSGDRYNDMADNLAKRALGL